MSRVLGLLAFASAMILAARPGYGSTDLYQTCSANPPNCATVPIPDSPSCGSPGAPATMTLTVPYNANCNIITNIDVYVWISHTYQGDLNLQLTSPSGTTITLMDRPGVPASPTGFSADDLGLVLCPNPPPPPCFLRAFVFSDSEPQTYDFPQVSFPGNTGGGAFPFWKPETPLSTFNGESKAGTWTLTVTDNCPGDTGVIRYLGLNITCEPPTPPIAEITAPAPFSCVCSPVTITGTANDPDGTLLGYVIDWAQNPNGPWTLICSVIPPVVNGTLCTWNTFGVPEGYTFVRLTAVNALLQSTTYTTVVYVDQTFDPLVIRRPLANEHLGGHACPDGAITDFCFQNYRVEVGPPPAGPFQPVDPGMPVYTSAVINDPLVPPMGWDTTALPDGTYRMRFTGTNTCGHTAIVMRDIVIDNTPPVALITSPVQCHYVDGVVSIIGTASDANLTGWTLQYTGGAAHGWVTIHSDTVPVVNGLLYNWNVSALPRCEYTLRLIVSDGALVDCVGSHSSEYDVSIAVGSCCDINRDGVGDGNDVQPFVNCLLGSGSCP